MALQQIDPNSLVLALTASRYPSYVLRILTPHLFGWRPNSHIDLPT